MTLRICVYYLGLLKPERQSVSVEYPKKCKTRLIIGKYKTKSDGFIDQTFKDVFERLEKVNAPYLFLLEFDLIPHVKLSLN